MVKMKKLWILLGVLAVLVVGTVLLSHHETKMEAIRTSGETILAIDPSTVTAIGWKNDTAELSFTRGEDGWVYDGDAAFPVSEDRIGELLTSTEDMRAAFTIDDVDELSQYGLAKPTGTVEITHGDEVTVLTMGDFSQMDSLRYVSIGDGKVYLASVDPAETFSTVLSDMIEHDTVPAFDDVEQVTVSGAEDYTFAQGENTSTACESDKYFADAGALDTDSVDYYFNSLRAMVITDYVTYNATDEELSACGLDTPDVRMTVDYPVADDPDREDSPTHTESFSFSLGQNRQELAEAMDTEEGEKPDLSGVTAYFRMDESPIVYTLTRAQYDALLKCTYNDLRHKALFTGSFDDVYAIDVNVDGESYTLSASAEAETVDENGDIGRVWYWGEEEIDISGLQGAVTALTADSFTSEKSGSTEELALTLHLDNDNRSRISLRFLRYDGEDCLAFLDGKPVALVARSLVVDTCEAVNAIVLKK